MKYVIEIDTNSSYLENWYSLKNELMSIRGIEDVEVLETTIVE